MFLWEVPVMADDKHLPPLISPRSPSYERARRELKNPSPSGDADMIALLNQLVEAEQDASRASLAASQALHDAALARRVGEAAAEHQARIHALGELVAALGGSPPRPEESREILTHGADEVTRATSDEAILSTLRAMRDELVALYTQAARDERLDPARRASLAALSPHG
jgi:hypothetical protein